MTTSLYNNIAIQMHTQPLNNRTVKHYGAIFRHVREDFIDITTRAHMCRETHYIGLNLKCWFCQSIKRKTRKQIPPKSGIKRMHYFLFGLASFSRQIAITQAEKLVLFGVDYLILISRDCNSFRIILFIQPASDSSPSSFCAFSIACRNSGSSLNWNGGLPRLFLFMCIDTPITSVLMYFCVMTHYHYIIKKTIAQRVRTSMSYLTTITLIEVMIMANSNDTLCPKNGQYDLPNLLSVLNLYQADIQPQNLLHAKAHLEELRQSILWGIGAIGNLLFWTSECEEYEEQQFKDDIRDIGYLLAQLKNVACFASNQINLLDDKLNHKEINDNE